MDQQTVQQVIQALREGATAASGAAREGFKQVCDYKAALAQAWFVFYIVIAIMMAVALPVLWKHSEKGFNMSGESFWHEILAPVFMASCVLLIPACMSASVVEYATMKNPAGAVISDIIKR